MGDVERRPTHREVRTGTSRSAPPTERFAAPRMRAGAEVGSE